jgi:hypothetical protein
MMTEVSPYQDPAPNDIAPRQGSNFESSVWMN